MTLSALGIFSAAGAGGGAAFASDYELIETQILGTATPSITFSSLSTYSSTYKHLQIRAAVGHTNAGSGNALYFRLNGDTGTNYSYHEMGGNGSSVYSTGAANTNSPLAVALRQPLSNTAFGGGVIDFLDAYSTTKNKTVRSLNGAQSTDSIIILSSGVRLNTEAISSITLFVPSGNISVNSRFSIYGIK